jgi:1-hydroxycarotenoid 3,4-desaturase
LLNHRNHDEHACGRLHLEAKEEQAVFVKAHIVIVGATVSGFIAALQLAAARHPVTLVEEAPRVLGETWLKGFAVPTSTALIAPFAWLEDVLRDSGFDASELFSYERPKELARVLFPGGGVLAMPTDAEDLRAALVDFSGAAAGRSYDDLRRDATRFRRKLEGSHLRSQRPRYLNVLRSGLRGGQTAYRALGLHESLRQYLQRTLQDPLLVAAFERYAWALGSDPRKLPSCALLLHDFEQRDCVQVRGGLPALLRGLERAATRAGVRIAYGVNDIAIDAPEGRIQNVITSRGSFRAQCLLWATSAASGPMTSRLLRAGVPVRLAQETSTVTWAIRGSVAGPKLGADNWLLSTDGESELDELFQERVVPDLPSVRLEVVAQAGARARAAADAADVADALLLHARVPGIRALDPEVLAEFESRVMEKLQSAGVLLRISAMLREEPSQRREAAFGPVVHGFGLLREGAYLTTPHVYAAGPTRHPGPTLAMQIQSGRRAAEAAIEDLSSRGI